MYTVNSFWPTTFDCQIADDERRLHYTSPGRRMFAVGKKKMVKEEFEEENKKRV